MNWTRRDWILLLAITALAALLRFFRLGEVPPGFQFDEAFNAIDAKQVLEGNYPLFLPANGGREALYTYWQATIGAFLGINAYSLRLASAILGTATVGAAYVMVRVLLRDQSRLVAAFTATTLAVSLWHMHFSRYGIRVITMPLILSGLFTCFWLGLHAGSRARRLSAFAVSGFLLGLTPWTHPSGRLVPFVLVIFVLWLLWRRPEQRRLGFDSAIGGLAISGLVAFLVFLPLGLEFLRHPDFFFGHASEVSIFADRVSGGNWLPLLLSNILHVFGMFSFFGDVEWAHNLAGRPVFSWFLAVPFYIGVFFWFKRIFVRRDADFDALSLLAIWSLVLLLPSVLSEAAPNYSRTLPAIPAIFVPAGLGLAWIVTFRWPYRWIGPVTAAVLVVAGAASTYQAYFVRFAAEPEVYYLYDANKLDALEYLGQFTEENQVYISQLWGDKHATVYFLRGEMDVASFDTDDTLVLPPPGRGAVYGFPDEQHRRAETLASYWPHATLEELYDPFGNRLLSTVFVPAEEAAGWPEGFTPTVENEARFIEAPTLVGLQTKPDRSDVVLFWREDESTFRDLTTFIHLIDADGRRVGQADQLPGDGSYRTPYWTTGERVVDHYYPTITDLCAYGEEVRIQVGWYQYLADNARMPRADAPGDSALAGNYTLPLGSAPWGTVTPAVEMSHRFASEMNLVGFELQGEALQAGSPLQVALYWQPPEDLDSTEVELLLEGPAGAQTLTTAALTPAPAMGEGEIACRRVRLRLPTEVAAGEYTLQLASGGEVVDLTTVPLGESVRAFDLPPIAFPVEAAFGEVIKLAGYNLPEAETEPTMLAVELVWQALGTSPAAYNVFVHVVDEEGRIVAQSDAMPAAGYPTTAWLPGEVIADRHEVMLPQDLASGDYQVLVGLYDPVSGERLTVIDADGAPVAENALSLGEVALP